jgi:hypothetical protein
VSGCLRKLAPALAPVLVSCVASCLMWSTAAQASQTQVHTVDGPDLFGGELEGAGISGDYRLTAGPEQKTMVAGIAGAVLGLARAGDGQLYVATGAPGKVYRVNGSALEEVYAADKPLVTALLPVGKDTLVALVTPDAGAQIIDLKTKKTERVAAPAKLLLGGAVLDDVVYAVGSTDDGGVVLKLLPGKKVFEVVATTKEALRSIAVRTVGGKLRLVVGGADEGVVYEVEGKTVRALLDAAPGETTALAIAESGAVLAAFVDGEGKLSKQASVKVKDEAVDDEGKKGPTAKPRKVKGGEVWRIEPAGAVRMLYQSKVHGPYALAIDGERKRVLVGTGPQGRLVQLGLTGTERAAVLTRQKGTDEITALLVEKAGVVAGTAHGGSVLFVGTAQTTSSWLSPALEADGRARFGLARVGVVAGSARIFLRTGNTKEPDESWGAWSAGQTASVAGSTFSVTPAIYAQLKVELAPGATVDSVHLAYLVDNRAPEVINLDVLAPGWRVTSNPRNPPESRSVTFGERPFAKFLDRRGAQNPTLEERPFGKQSFDIGYRTVYAYVEDADKDALRYRFWLGAERNGAAPTSWKPLGEWTEEPFASFEASRLADGDYRVKVEVDDSPTNGHTRALRDSGTSAAFTVSHQAPVVTDASATRSKDSVTVRLAVKAALPLVSVRCSTDMSEWLPLDAADGLLDAASERFEATLPATSATSNVSCEFYDEALSFQRTDIPVR